MVMTSQQQPKHINLDKQFSPWEPLMFAKGLMKYLENHSFYMNMRSSASSKNQLPKYMIISESSSTICNSADPEVVAHQLLLRFQQKSTPVNLISANARKEPPDETKREN